ncbi:MAG TPA: hypothetical protein IAC38_05040 [Candidatus Caccovivens faecavium]|nr:hypothetical protein [Candidatus Caccovivens faecavium]
MFKLKQKQNNIEIENEENARNVEKQNTEQNVEQSTEQNQPLSEAKSSTVSIQSVEEDNKKKCKDDKKVIKWGPNRVLQCFAYFSVALIAIAMILRLIFKNQPDIAIYMQGVGECLAYIVCIWLGFYFTRKRGNIWWLVGWIIASVILIIFYVFAIV